MQLETRANPDGWQFTAAGSADMVIARNSACPDLRLADIMAVLTRHLHAAVQEIRPTPEEWMQAISFLTRTGQACTDRRQEFILLSDVLGVSMLVDALGGRRPPGATENTLLGPHGISDAPDRPNGADICLDGRGTPMLVRGRVLDGAGNPVQGAVIDVWQAGDDGAYGTEDEDRRPDFNLRGAFRSAADGAYWFRSVLPRGYKIPDDGPVGDLLAALGRHPWRPAHLHFMVTAPGFETVTTHVFVPDDPYIASDAVFGVKESLIGRFVPDFEPARAEALGLRSPFVQLDFDFVLVPLR